MDSVRLCLQERLIPKGQSNTSYETAWFLGHVFYFILTSFLVKNYSGYLIIGLSTKSIFTFAGK